MAFAHTVRESLFVSNVRSEKWKSDGKINLSTRAVNVGIHSIYNP